MAWRRWGEAVARLREPVRRAECAVLFFPVAVTVLAALGGALAALFLVVCANPYLTSWRHYGHPLYPVYSVDEARFPSHDLTSATRTPRRWGTWGAS